jgi:hypothetical protein
MPQGTLQCAQKVWVFLLRKESVVASNVNLKTLHLHSALVCIVVAVSHQEMAAAFRKTKENISPA